MGDDVSFGSICFYFSLNLRSAAQFVVYGRLTTLDDSLSLPLSLIGAIAAVKTQNPNSTSKRLWSQCDIFVSHTMGNLKKVKTFTQSYEQSYV